MTNEELIQAAKEMVEKGIIATSDLATAGKLNPEQANKFIDFVIDITMLHNNVRVVRFRPESLDIDKIGVGQRVTVPKAEAQAPTIRRGVTTSKVTLTPVELMTPFEISDNFVEINIEGDSVEDTIVRMMATQTANDMEELMINGYTEGPARLESDMMDGGSATQYVKDSYIALFDGWLRLADGGNIYDASGADVSSTFFSRMINSMPVKFRRTRRDMRFLVSLDHEQLYREKVASRATGAGDAALQSQDALRPFGVPLIGVPLLEKEPRVVEHITLGAAVDTQALRYGPISAGSVVVTPDTLGNTPVTPFVEGAAADYTIDYTAGTISNVGGGAMAAGGTFKVTYTSYGQVLLTNYANLILGIGRDIRMERDRDIYKSTNQYAISTKIAVEVEELTALVKGINVGIN
jgi:hypothetical protein